jgi:NAD(P)-dependent dehydrogenase (short-subunit alcohol dehydrogenase family)
MVKLDLVRSTNAALVASQPLVAVFVGGTSGIGKFSLHTLAATHGRVGKGLRVYIVGRNATAAQKIISECQELCPTGQFIFIQARDIALLKDVDRVSAELIEIEEKEAKAKSQMPKIDILVMSQGIFKPFDPRDGK